MTPPALRVTPPALRVTPPALRVTPPAPRVAPCAAWCVALLVAAAPAFAAPRTPAPLSARTLEPGAVETSLVDGLRLGVARHLELEGHPLVFLALPHVGVKLAWGAHGPWSFATRHRLAYPSLFLSLIAREGAGGLLPAGTDVPVALELTNELVASIDLGARHTVGLGLAVTVAPRLTSGEDLPILDFPFLYPRFAALETWATLRARAAVDGLLADALAYDLTLDAFALPLDPLAWALELGTSLLGRITPRFAVGAGVRVSLARYPIGVRFHYLPVVDARLTW